MSTIPKELLSNDGAEMRDVNGRQVFVGRLPDDFLSVSSGGNDLQNGTTSPVRSQVQTDHALACRLERELNQESRTRMFNQGYSAQITMNIIEAKLAKNYGILMNMSTYVRFQIGACILETRTAVRGGKEPKWNETIRCNLPRDTDRIWIEIYQDCLMSTDERIAEGYFLIPSEALQFSDGEREKTIEATIPLNGKQGTEREGTLTMVIKFRDINYAERIPTIQRYIPERSTRNFYPFNSVQPAYMVPPAYSDLAYITPIVPQLVPTFRQEDFDSLKEMFPKIDPEVIRTTLTSNNGNVDATTTALLELNSTTE